MVRGARGFDRVAGYYDRLAKLVFGDSLLKAQHALTNALPGRKTILVAGGGTGAVLAALRKAKPKQLHFLEASKKMMALAKKNDYGAYPINWLYADVREVDLPAVDVVVTQFFLDVFEQEEAKHLIKRLAAHVPEGGYWLYADFLPAAEVQWYQGILLWLMLRFFRITVGLSAKAVTNHLPMIEAQGFRCIASERHVNGMVQVCLLRKGT